MSEEEKLADKIKALTQMFSHVYVNNFSDTSKIYELQPRLEKVKLLRAEFSIVQADLQPLDTKNDFGTDRINCED